MAGVRDIERSSSLTTNMLGKNVNFNYSTEKPKAEVKKHDPTKSIVRDKDREALVKKHVESLFTLNSNGTFSHGNMNNLWEIVGKIVKSAENGGYSKAYEIGEIIAKKCIDSECELTQKQQDNWMTGITPEQLKILVDTIVLDTNELQEKTWSESCGFSPRNATADQIEYLRANDKNEEAEVLAAKWEEVRHELGFGSLKV